MRKISRRKAEQLFQISRVVEKQIKQDREELRLLFSLSNHHSLHVVYNLKNHRETFFIDEFSKTSLS
ncbi:MAG: hypothetical protein HGA23_09085 [Bacteroidales bacterium]|nr:hypothetical protein [Bacteroidales bacterium]